MRLFLALAVFRCALAQPAHFHHLHLNAADPAAAIDFYTSKFDCTKARLDGAEDAVQAQNAWLRFQKAPAAPPWELVSAIWHFGWGAEDMPATYQKHLAAGTKFFTPLTDISGLAGRAGFYYAYVEGPDRALIEINTAGHHRFGHVHLLSEDPPAAGEWYARHLGLSLRRVERDPRIYEGQPVAPSAALSVDGVSLLIYPAAYSRQMYPAHWNGRTAMAPTKGRVVDHVAFAVGDLAATVARLRAAGVSIESAPNGGSAFLEGPDRIRIELLEDHAGRR